MNARMGKFLMCPTCGYKSDSHAAVGPKPAQPKPGDAGLCLRCGQVLIYEIDMVGLRFRLPTHDELDERIQDDRIATVLAAWVATYNRTPEMRHS